MTDIHAADAPAAPVQPVPPEAAAPSAPAPDVEPDETPDTRTARERVIDHLEDTEGPQTVAAIMQGAGLDRGLLDSTLTRAVQRGLIERVAQGLYRLAPSKPKPEPPPQVIDGRLLDEWMALLERWFVDPDSWNVERDGPPPNVLGNRVPLPVHAQFKLRIERRKAQEAADEALLDRLLAACNDNYGRDGRLLDLRPIHTIMNSGVRVETIIDVLHNEVDRSSYPKNRTIVSWGEPWFLLSVAEQHARFRLAPRCVARWQKRLAGAPVAKDTKNAPGRCGGRGRLAGKGAGARRRAGRHPE
jgi:hypothetical protein